MIKNVADLTTDDFSKGLNTVIDLFKIEKNQSPNCMDVKFNFDGTVLKRLGTNTMNSVALSASNGTLGVTTCGWAAFDFGASATRWLTVAAGTAIWASSDLGFSFVRIASDRSNTYQYFERSKNVLVACSEARDTVLAWPGSAGTTCIMLNSNAPATKYAINFQGFLILLNSSLRRRGFFYEDENTQLTGTWSSTNSFDLPSSDDDEITGAFLLRKFLYVSTRYRLFRVLFNGGNPDWAFTELKGWGFVPRTAQRAFIKTQNDSGEVVIGMSWDRHIRLFDGSNDHIISDNIENDNLMCDFATSKISYAGSGLLVNYGEYDPNEQTYRLALAIGTNSSETTHFLNFNGRALSFYPYYNQNIKYQSMCVAESGGRQFLMAVDQSGWIHMMDSGNKDRNTYPINEVFDSTFLFEKSPSQYSKSKKIELYFAANSAGSIRYSDRFDFSSTFTPRQIFQVNSDGKRVNHVQQIDIPASQNVYQYRIDSSNGTDQWKMIRQDYFLTGMGIGREVRP